MQERIKKLGKYFQGMNVAPSPDGTFIMYVEVIFPDKWIILDSTTNDFGVRFAPNDNNSGYYFWSTADKSDDIFNAIDANIKVNEDAEKRIQLMLTKVNELKSIFASDEYDLETLSTLEFKFTTPSKPKTKTKSPKKVKKEEDKPKEEIKEETETINEDEIVEGL